VTYASFLSAVQFQGYGTGATFLLSPENGVGVFELAPVPEPVTVLAVAFGALALGAGVRRRLRGVTSH
jgi:hypothetical protein